jgi:hypothetical protein
MCPGSRKSPSPAGIGVRDAIRNFNADGFDSLYPRYRSGYPLKFAPEFPVAEVPYL